MKFNATINWCGHTIEREIEAESKEDADRILESQIVSETEITIEANPENLPTVKVEKLGQYRGENGSEVRITAYNEKWSYPFSGFISEDGQWKWMAWASNGKCMYMNNASIVEFIREIEFPPIDEPVEEKPKDVIDGPGLYEGVNGDRFVTLQTEVQDNAWIMRDTDNYAVVYRSDGMHRYGKRHITRKLIDFDTMEVLNHDTH